MKYVNKSNEAIANPIIDRYLAFAKRERWYSAVELYKGFRGGRGKHDLIDQILLPEQDNQCCYCRQKIQGHTEATIEHIIRQSIPNAVAMIRYFKPQYVGLNDQNICHTDDYVSGQNRPGQYPHKVAYHNFAIACPMCNMARGHQDIDPPFLYPTIDQEVDYNRQTGELTWLTDPESIKAIPTAPPTVEKVCLNKPLLKAIRAVWFYGVDHPTATYSTPDTITCEAEKQELVYLTFGNALSSDPFFTVEDMEAYLSLLKPHFWDMALKYAYFATI